MPVLRIIPPPVIVQMTGPREVLLSGTIKDSIGMPLPNRTIRVFMDQGMGVAIGTTYSLADGTFSITVPGGPVSRFVVAAQGETGENCQVFSNIMEPV